MSEEENERIERFIRKHAEINKLQRSQLRIDFEKIRIENESNETKLRIKKLLNYNTNNPIPDGLVDEEERDNNKIIIGVEVRIINPNKKTRSRYCEELYK